MGIFGRNREPDLRPTKLHFTYESDKEYAGYQETADAYFDTFTDGSWFNATTGQLHNATGTGTLYLSGTWE